MRKILIRGMLFICVFSLHAQAPDTIWTRTFGGVDYEYSYEVQQTSDGGYIVVGLTYSFGAGLDDFYLIKTDSNGDTLWTKTYGGPNYDAGKSVQQTSDGGYIITGLAECHDPFDGMLGLIKTDTNGDTLWTRKYGGAGIEEGYSVKQTVDDGYIAVGQTTSFGAGHADVYLVKTDSLGDSLWIKIYGGTGWDIALSVQQTTDEGYVISAFTTSFGTGGQDVYLLKTDSLGDTLWSKTYGGSGDDSPWSVQQTSDGGYVICGYTKSFGGADADVYLIKTDANGDTIWTRYFGGDSTDIGTSVQQTADGGYIITGQTESFGTGNGNEDVWLIKTDSNGDTIWTRTIGGPDIDQGSSVQQTIDNGFIIVGDTQSYGAGVFDFWLIKTEPDIGIKEDIIKKGQNLIIPGFVYGNVLKLSNIANHMNVKIFDVIGREILNQKVAPQKSYIRLNDLTSGVYFLYLEEEQPKLHKFVLVK